MKVINSGYFVKSVSVLFFAGMIVGCGEQAKEESAEQNQPEITTQASESDIDTVETKEAGEAVGEGETDSAETAQEESLESILARADEIIQRTESSLDQAGDNAKQELEETAKGITEKTETLVAETLENDATKTIIDDGLKVVKASPDLIRKIQQALRDANLNPGPADGMMGPRTQNALVEFQNQHNLAAGKITKETLRELNIDF